MIEPLLTCIYENYPRREGKLKALQSIAKALKLIQKEDSLCLFHAHEKLLRSVVKFSKHWEYLISSGKKEKEFVPHPATWMNQGRWADEDAWELPPAAERELTEEWARENWYQVIARDYGIHWEDKRYFCTEWTKTLDNLPSAVRADLKSAFALTN